MSKIRENLVTNCEKKFLLKSLSEWMRLDGRAFDEFRNLKIQFSKDWGCCYVSLGKTRVFAQTSCEIQQPKSSRPSEGILNINLELNPIAAPNFEAGRQSETGVQLNRLLEKLIKDSKAVDLESLCIKTNEKVWSLRCDLNVINHEGNIVDCASIALLTSLAHFRRPDVTCNGEEFIIHSIKQRDPIRTVIHHYPICVTFAIFNGGEFIVADPNLLEEGVAEAFLTIGINSFKELCTLHLGGKVETTPDRILQSLNKASLRVNSIVGQIKECIDRDNEKRERLLNTIGHYNNFFEDDDGERTVQTLEQCLDVWQAPKVTDRKTNKKKIGEIQIVEENTAVFLPNDASNDDDDDDDVKFIPTEKQISSVEILDSQSEEDDVIIVEN